MAPRFSLVWRWDEHRQRHVLVPADVLVEPSATLGDTPPAGVADQPAAAADAHSWLNRLIRGGR